MVPERGLVLVHREQNPVTQRLRAAAWRTASRAEQEIRAYPRLYAAFYRVLAARPGVRRAVGRVKNGVREDGTRAGVPAVATPDTRGDQRRRASVALRLGLARDEVP